jgi:DNA-binding response OmpR family regulator
MKKEKILIVDDEQSICEILEFNLKSEEYQVEIANSAEEALTKINSDTSLILLDVMMNGMSGYKLAEKLRIDNNQIPIIFLTAKDTENDMLTAFSVGGDDYIQKPFSIKEVSARVKALLKRTTTQKANKETSNKLIIDALQINLELKIASVDNVDVNLTKTEFEILMTLVEHTERVLSRQEIMDAVWGDNVLVTDRTVDVHITRLRKKLGYIGRCITNRSGFGYRFDKTAL